MLAITQNPAVFGPSYVATQAASDTALSWTLIPTFASWAAATSVPGM